MSVSSCEVDGHGSNAGDFCCTEEELFQSFMEIVNDPELQEVAGNEQQEADGRQNSSILKTSISDDASARVELNKEEENAINPADDQSTKEQVESIEHNVTSNLKQSSPPENADVAQNGLKDLNDVEPASENLPDMKQDPLDSQNEKKDQGEVLEAKHNDISQDLQSNKNSEISSVGPDEQHANSDLKQTDQSKSVQQQSSMQKRQSNSDLVSTQKKPEVVSSILLRQPTSPRSVKAEDSTFSLPPSSRNEAEIVSSILLRQPTGPRKVKEEGLPVCQQQTDEIGSTDQVEVGTTISNQNEEEVSSTNQGEAEVSSTNQGEAEVSSTNQSEAAVSSTNQSEAEGGSTNQSEAEVSSTNQGEANFGSINQSELQDSIEEGIRKANQVCEELNALTQRMSHSSDELLDDSDSEWRKTDRNSLRREEVVSNGESTQNNLTNSADTDPRVKDVNTKVENQRPISLPKLMVNNQSSPSISSKHSPEETTPSPSQTTPSPSMEPSASPLGISPSRTTFIKDEKIDRKSSMSDSLDSSEGSLGGDIMPSPSQNQGPFNWDILNTALADNDTDDDQGVYESSGGYGGFGLVLDEESSLAADGRLRSVSQSSTFSEAQFQEEYKKKHSTGSLDRNSGKLFTLSSLIFIYLIKCEVVKW